MSRDLQLEKMIVLYVKNHPRFFDTLVRLQKKQLKVKSNKNINSSALKELAKMIVDLQKSSNK